MMYNIEGSKINYDYCFDSYNAIKYSQPTHFLEVQLSEINSIMKTTFSHCMYMYNTFIYDVHAHVAKIHVIC